MESSSGSRRFAAAMTILLCSTGCASLAGRALPAEQRTIARATRLLPVRLEIPVVVVDPALAPDPVAVTRVDAFTVREADGSMRRAIYINGRSRVFAEARGGSKLSVAILAAVIQHEASHLDGADEATARRAERDLFNRLVAGGAVGREQGLAYLSELARAYGPHGSDR
jgi:hypothetical protein